MSEAVSGQHDRYLRLRGDGANVNRYRVDKGNTHVHLYLDVRGQHTLADLLAAVAEVGVDPEDVTFRGGCFVLTVPATPDDVAGWEASERRREESARASRRAWFERLRAEFEPAAAD